MKDALDGLIDKCKQQEEEIARLNAKIESLEKIIAEDAKTICEHGIKKERDGQIVESIIKWACAIYDEAYELEGCFLDIITSDYEKEMLLLILRGEHE